MNTSDVTGTAQQARHSPVVEKGARLGYAVIGLVHLLIGYLALRIAFGGGGEQADQSGALSTLASNPGGAALLWIAVVGFALLAVWQVTVIATDEEAKEKAVAAGKAVMYAAFAVTASRLATGGSSDSREQTQDFTATLMEDPGGRIAVGLIGLAVIGGGGFHVYQGWTEGFLEDLAAHPGRWAVVAGRIGYVAKGVALIVVGGLFVVAALKERASEATGLDGALRTLREAPYGKVLLTLVAIGIAAYGVYSFARARYAKV